MIFLALLLIVVLLTLFFQPIIPMRRRQGQGWARFPWITLALVVINTIVFFATSERLSLAANTWGVIPLRLTAYSLITYAFLHGDFLHLLGNMAALYLIGSHVEDALGTPRYLLLYVICAIAAAAAQAAVSIAALPYLEQLIPLVGASGAIFGLMGFFAVRFWRTRVRLFWIPRVPAVVAVGFVALLQIILAVRSLTSRDHDPVAYVAHLGGFLFGLAMAIPLRALEQSRREYDIEDAEAAVAAGDFSTAARYYRELIARTPDDGGLHHALALVCVRLNHNEAAHRHFMDALERFLRQGNAEAVARIYADARATLLRVSVPARFLLRISAACEECQQFGLAQQALAHVCREYPNTPDGELGLLKQGKLQLQRLERPGEAAVLFKEFLRLYPRSEWTNHVQGLLAEAQSRLQ